MCVNVNVRTFGLGFLYKKGTSLPSSNGCNFTGVAGGDIPANLGLLDIVAALQWVKAEIGAFGGDPDNGD